MKTAGIPEGVKLVAQADIAGIEQALYQDAFKALAGISLPVLEWIPYCMRFPSRVDLRLVGTPAGVPPVLNQGTLGSCVDNSYSTLLDWCYRKEDGVVFQASRLFLYGNARGWSASDSGSSLGACDHGARTYGAPLESVWPYDISKFADRPPETIFSVAFRTKTVRSYYLLSLGEMLHCLSSGWPFSVCMSTYSTFGTATTADGQVLTPMPTPKDKYTGGHCVTVIGYDLKSRLFLAQNSWGLEWGTDGCFWLSFDYVASPMLANGWRTVRGVTD